MGRDADFFGRIDQVEVAHQLADRSNNLTGDAARGPPDHVTGGIGVEEPFTELSDRHVFELVVDLLVDSILDDPGHFILFIGDSRIVAQVRQGDVGQDNLRGNPFFGTFGGDASQFVTRFFLICLGHDFTQ